MNAFLFVCSANMLRSPTAEHVARSMGYSADSAGSVPHYSPIRPLTLEAIERAEKIVCMEPHHAKAVYAVAPHRADDVEVWHIPDDFDYCDAELVKMIQDKLPPRSYTKHRS